MIWQLKKEDVGKIVSFGLERKLTLFERALCFSRAYGRVLDVGDSYFLLELHPLYPVIFEDIKTIRHVDYRKIKDIQFHEE